MPNLDAAYLCPAPILPGLYSKRAVLPNPQPRIYTHSPFPISLPLSPPRLFLFDAFHDLRVKRPKSYNATHTRTNVFVFNTVINVDFILFGIFLFACINGLTSIAVLSRQLRAKFPLSLVSLV